MAFNLYAAIPLGKPGPARGLEIPFRMVFVGYSGHAFLHAIEGELHFGGRVVSTGATCTKVHFAGGSGIAVLQRMAETNAALFCPLSREAIRHIDEKRGKDDLAFSLTLRVKWQEAEESPPPAGGRLGYRLGAIQWTEQSPNWTPVASSTWNRCLQQMEYQLREVIEIPQVPFGADPALVQGLALLKSAEGHARDGDWRDVLTNCRVALESLSRYEAPGKASTKRGFELLLARAYPDERDAPRRERMNGFIREVRELCSYFGPHTDQPPLHPSRAEALLAFNATTSLLAALGSALAEASNRTGDPTLSASPTA
jgi:hypothetical protein